MKIIPSKRIKDKKAITLIALVITIVVLIILAAVAINLTVGENGIITQAKRAKDLYQTKANEESASLANFDDIVERLTVALNGGRGEITSEEVSSLINQAIELKLADYAKTSDLNDYATKSELNNKADKTEIPSGGIQRTLLTSGTTDIPVTTSWTERNIDVQLNQSRNNFKFLEIQYCYISSGPSYYTTDTKIIANNQQKNFNQNTASWGTTMNDVGFSMGIAGVSYNALVYGWFKDDTTLHIAYSHSVRSSETGIRISAIYGLN